MKAAVLGLAVLGATCSAWAQECNTIDSDDSRLKCFDAKFPRPAAVQPGPAPAGIAPPPIETARTLPPFLKNVKLANEATPSGTLRTDPASFGFSKLNSEEYSVIQAALVWEPGWSWFPEGGYLAEYGWGPYTSISVNRNTLTTKRADTRQLAVGLFGTLFSIPAHKEPGQLIAPIALAALSKVEAAQRRNKVDGTESMLYTWDNWFTSKWLFGGIPYTDQFAWFVTPRIGLQTEDRRTAKAGNPLGSTKSAFAQLRVDLFPGGISDRMKIGFTAQRYVDLSADAGVTERAETFGKASIEFLLSPPRASNTITPSLALERSYGADLINGTPKQGLTQLVFKMKLN